MYQAEIDYGFIGFNWSEGNDNYGSACDCDGSDGTETGLCEGWVKGPICDRPLATMNMQDAYEVWLEAAYCYPTNSGGVDNGWQAQFVHQYIKEAVGNNSWLGDPTSMISMVQNTCIGHCTNPSMYNCADVNSCRWACEDIQYGGPEEFISRGCGNKLFDNEWESGQFYFLH